MKLYGGTKKNIPEQAFTPVDFDTDTYKATDLYVTDRGTMVAVMVSNESTPYPWKVFYDSSECFFRTHKEAVAFCEKRFRPSVRQQRR